MSLENRVTIARRFQRSIRIDTDLGDTNALEGFVCPQTSANVLITMARHVAETKQGAFTWTGPYGSGKSSLVVALSALLNGNTTLQKQASKVFGSKLANSIWQALPPKSQGWKILPVVGRRDDPVTTLGDALHAGGFIPRSPRGGWTERHLLKCISEVASENPRSHGGIIIFIDEMGKFLEAAAQERSDIYIFQQLAEAASRSNGRLIIVGILHQAFEEYAHRLTREMRDEWAKIQGRFVDLAVNTAGEEQIDLISRAIDSDHSSVKPSARSLEVASIVKRDKTSETNQFASMLESCWPLHPVVAGLLGPISRRRFGQNQRSIFGFLNSAEPHGFQEFIRSASDDDIYTPDKLWDYLRANLEPSILASPDGHRWALAAEALERCESLGGDALHLSVLKTIAVIDLFKERSGLVPGLKLLQTCYSGISRGTLTKAIEQLDKWSLVIYKKFLDAFAVYAGSDFDIEEAVSTALSSNNEVDFDSLKTLAGLHPILAKRHYHETGILRWFDVNIAPASGLLDIAETYRPTNGVIGQFLLVIPTEGEDEGTISETCRIAARSSDPWDIVVGISKRAWTIVPLAQELLALQHVSDTSAELSGDPVARREVSARLAALQGQLEMELHKALDRALWFRKHHQPKHYRQPELNILASELADRRYSECPRLHNELLNRQKPSGSAIAAQNTLLRKMVLNEGEPRLGITGFPAEGGLFSSLLEATGLYTNTSTGWQFGLPSISDDKHRLLPIWKAAYDFVRKKKNRTVAVAEIYDIWREQPYGVKDGLLPTLAVAFILSQRNHLAFYRDGIFRARITDVDVEYLAKDPAYTQLRWMDLSDISRKLLSEMADIVRKLDQDNSLVHLEPIDVARGLVSVYDNLPQWSKRTMRLSSNAVQVRELFKRSNDPNKFLFDDIPTVISTEDPTLANEKELQRVISGLQEGMDELVEAYPSMLHRLRDIMLSELQVPNISPQSLSELRDRAENIRQLAGDFHVEAFVARLSQLDASDTSFEGIASLAANKPPRDWVDHDLDRAMVEIADMAQKFLRAETFTRVKGRPEKRHSMAVVVGVQGKPTPILKEFQVTDSDRDAIDALIQRVSVTLEAADTGRRNIILAALAELSAQYMTNSGGTKRKKRKRRAAY